MPLQKGAKPGSKGFKENIKAEMSAGKPEKQAVAIAYSESSEDDLESHRIPDLNNWFEIKGNPLSKVGVFPYSGAQINPDLEPDKIYNVYRPEEELSNQATIDSFKLLPWIDEHVMLGSTDEGLMPAERKGVHGVIGEDVYFEDGYLKGNLKIFSQKLAKLIEEGKKELSIGYRCLYELARGTYDGVPYDAIQREIRGNHLALVDEGRSGPDVAVLDHNHKFIYALDGKVLKMSKDEMGYEDKEMEAPTLDSIHKMVQDIAGRLGAIEAEKTKDAALAEGPKDDTMRNEGEKVLDEEPEAKGPEDDDEKNEGKKALDEDTERKDGDESRGGVMDAQLKQLSRKIARLEESANPKKWMREVSMRDDLAKRLSNHIGVFDCAEKTHLEVAQYGLKQLGIKARAGAEIDVLDAYLLGKKQTYSSVAADSRPAKSDQVEAYLAGAN